MPDEKQSFVSALKEFFGFRPNTGAGEFMKEYKALDAKDKQDFYEMLRGVGFDCAPPIAGK